MCCVQSLSDTCRRHELCAMALASLQLHSEPAVAREVRNKGAKLKAALEVMKRNDGTEYESWSANDQSTFDAADGKAEIPAGKMSGNDSADAERPQRPDARITR